MSQSTTIDQAFTSHASLAALLASAPVQSTFDLLRKRVHIAQKTVKDSPQDKVQDILITLLAGGHSLVEINTLLRSDSALQRSCGRQRCCEQSVAQQTLDRASPENVEQLQAVLTSLLHSQSQAAAHPYHRHWQVLDMDLTGMPCGLQAQEATKGYFSARKRVRRGRQQARVLASGYEEIVVDALYPGNTNLMSKVGELMEQPEAALDLTPSKRRRCVVRLDAAGGTIEAINTLLRHDYAVSTKDFSTARARNLAKSVQQWVQDPHHPDRELGWVQQETQDYLLAPRRLAVRYQQPTGKRDVAVLLFFRLRPADIFALLDRAVSRDETAIMAAYCQFYDQRGGGVETSFAGDKSGLGISKRNKKLFVAQQMLMLLGTLAHNLLIWSRRWLCQSSPSDAVRFMRYGIKRMIRDLYHISGKISFDQQGRLVAIALNEASPLARLLLLPLRHWLDPFHIDVSLDKI